MTQQPDVFGHQLRQRRLAAGLSLRQLAEQVHYSRGYLSKIESGEKPPTPLLARQCDAALGAQGALAALARPWGVAQTDRPPSRLGHQTAIPPAPALLPLLPSPPSEAGIRPAAAGAAASQQTTLAVFRGFFEQYRVCGHQASPALVLPVLVEQTRVLQILATHAADAGMAEALLLLAARYAEYTGWMTQEAGQDRTAMWWTDLAVRFARAARDSDLAQYALVRGADIALYQDDARQTVELAQAAQSDPATSPRILSLAAQREAQGCALAGDPEACLAALDRAAEFAGQAADSDPASGPFGTTSLADPVAVTTGWAMHDLGQSALAAAILDREVPRIPEVAVRARARYSVRRALAHVMNGELDYACQLAAEAMPDIERADSATIRIDLRRFAHAVARWHTYPAVRELYPRLSDALHVPLR